MSSTEWVAPAITGGFALILAVVSTLLGWRGAKLGAREQRAPDVQELWVQQEADRRMRQLMEDMWWNLRRAFQLYYRRVTQAVAHMNMDPRQAELFELTPQELSIINANPPEEPEEKKA